MVKDLITATRRQEHKVIKLKVLKKKLINLKALDYIGSGDNGICPAPDIPIGEVPDPSGQVLIKPITSEQPTRITE